MKFVKWAGIVIGVLIAWAVLDGMDKGEFRWWLLFGALLYSWHSILEAVETNRRLLNERIDKLENQLARMDERI